MQQKKLEMVILNLLARIEKLEKLFENPEIKNGKIKNNQDFLNLIQTFNSISGKNFRSLDCLKMKYAARRKSFKPKEILEAAKNLLADEFMIGVNSGEKFYATPEYLLRNDNNINKYLDQNQTCKLNPYGTLPLGPLPKG